MNTSLWYEKHRPRTLDEYVWIDDELKEKISRYLDDPGKIPHMCLVGHPGTGKTTLARLIANRIVQDPNDVLEVRSSRDNGTDMVRSMVEPFCQSAGWSELKFVIFDEAERLTMAAWEMLRGTFNDYGDHVRFLFTCNNALVMKNFMDSRIRTIHFDGLDRDQFIDRIVSILQAENVDLDEASVGLMMKIIDRYYPDMRKTIDMLEDSCVNNKLVEAKRISKAHEEWMDGLFQHLRGALNIKELREKIADLSPDQILEVYPALDAISGEIFDRDEGLAIVSIRDHMIAHKDAGFPGLNLLGLFIQLSYIKTGR